MRLSVFLLVLTVTYVSGIYYHGFSSWPYCYSTTNGHFLRDGDDIPFVDYANSTYELRDVNSAVFVNGLNLGLDENGYFVFTEGVDPSFLMPNGADPNGTANYFPYNATYWDFGLTGVGAGSPDLTVYALIDGTYDTVDGGMAFTIDLTGMFFHPTTNPILTCSENGVELRADNVVNDLTVVQHFYVAKGYDSWARAVGVVYNPTNADITAKIGFYNNLGSDDDTVYLEKNPRYWVTADALNDTALLEYYKDGFGDNPLSIHWSSQGSSSPLPSLQDIGLEYVNFYWDVTIKPNETQSFMMILVQNRFSVQESLDNATYIDSNPFNIYEGLSSDVLSTLKNFNACAITIPPVTVSETSSCTSFGGSATLTIADYDLSFTLVLVDSTGTQHSVVNNMVSAPNGDYALVLQLYPGCEHVLHTGTVTCPAAPTAVPVTAPTSTQAPGASQTPSSSPTGKTSAAISTTGHGAIVVAMSSVALFALMV